MSSPVYLSEEFKQRAASLRALSSELRPEPLPPEVLEFQRYRAPCEAVREASREFCELWPEWSFEDDAQGGALVLGPSVCKLARIYFDAQFISSDPWRWGLETVLAGEERGSAPDVVSAGTCVSLSLARLELRRAEACPGCGLPSAYRCHRDIVIAPSCVLAVRCLRGRGHSGPHVPVCEHCYTESSQAWSSGLVLKVGAKRLGAVVP